MIAYKLDYDDKQVRELFQKLEADMPEINRRILGVLSEEVVTRSQRDYLRGGHPLNRVTGNLAQSLTHKVYGSYAEVGSNLVYAPVHEFGATINPGAKGFLAWKDRQTGKWIYTRKPVRIPPRPYLRPALDDVFQTGRAVTIIEGVLRDEIRRRGAAA